MTKNGIVHLAFHPCTDKLVLAAADKSGHIGLWSVDNELAAPSGSASKENEGPHETGASVKGEDASKLFQIVHIAPQAQQQQAIRWHQSSSSLLGAGRCMIPTLNCLKTCLASWQCSAAHITAACCKNSCHHLRAESNDLWSTINELHQSESLHKFHIMLC